MGEVIYIISLSLQISGALILLLEWCKNKDDVLAEEYYKEKLHMGKHTKDDNVEMEIDPKSIEKIMKNVYANRVAFLLIFAGYILNIFGDAVEDKWVAAFFVFLLTLILIGGIKYFIDKKAKKEMGSPYNEMVLNANIPNGAFRFLEDETTEDNFTTKK